MAVTGTKLTGSLELLRVDELLRVEELRRRGTRVRGFECF
jgi:hypothetical protein